MISRILYNGMYNLITLLEQLQAIIKREVYFCFWASFVGMASVSNAAPDADTCYSASIPNPQT